MRVYCVQGRTRGERWSIHWHDLFRPDNAGIVARALAEGELFLTVARHKAMFFLENDSSGQGIDSEAVVLGDFGSFPQAPLRRPLLKTTPVRSPAGCCWTRTSRSAPSCSDAL